LEAVGRDKLQNGYIYFLNWLYPSIGTYLLELVATTAAGLMLLEYGFGIETVFTVETTVVFAAGFGINTGVTTGVASMAGAFGFGISTFCAEGVNCAKAAVVARTRARTEVDLKIMRALSGR
jgi:hypothetical protein